jgi:methyltransferase
LVARSTIAYLVLLAALAAQRLLEKRLSRSNEARIRQAGGREHVPGQLWWMTGLHLSWFVAIVVELIHGQRPFLPWLAAPACLLFLAGQALRYAAIRSLGWRWTVRVMTVPGAPAVQSGPYRFIRHPNYLGVALEVAAVPLIHSAYLTAAFFSLANALLLAWRIRAEERALADDNAYQRDFGLRPRFLPPGRPDGSV